jgi:ferrous iron transport protein B
MSTSEPVVAAGPTAAVASSVAPVPVVVLLGNPNSGKTTLFNALTGASARVGNYPGVTVDHREGALKVDDALSVRLLDLPGTYSLVPRAEDEVVALRGLLGRLPMAERPRLTLAVVDATNLERNLYIVEQLLELGVPLLVVLTMMDTIEADGLSIDKGLLSKRLGAPVVAVSSASGAGLDSLKMSIRRYLSVQPLVSALPPPVPAPTEIEELGRLVAEEWALDAPPAALGWWALAVREGGAVEHIDFGPQVKEALRRIVATGPAVERLVTARYARVATWLENVSTRRQLNGPTRSELLTNRIDRIALHRVVGPIVMVLVFGALFQALFTWSKPVMDALGDSMKWLGEHVATLLPTSFPLFRSLIVDGLIAGVGSVIVFVPQIAVLFFCLGLLEDSGYLARAAFLLDRLMARVGLHGRAFIPMLSGFACAVPAILAARTIESRKDRLITILVTPLMSCSARLPVYGLMIATVFATQPPIFGVFHVGAVVMISMYVLSIVAALGMAAVFKRTLLRSPTPPFVLELPPYRLPRLVPLLRHVSGKVRRFLADAGTVILAITLVLWGLFHFPQSSEIDARRLSMRTQVEATATNPAACEEQLNQIDATAARERLEYSIAGRLGHAIEPAIKPLGWDWKVGVGIIASFAAREVLVSTLGLVYGLGQGADSHSTSLQEAMRNDRDPVTGKPIHTPLSGLSLMVFFVLAMQCMSTLAAVRRETGSWKWPAFQFGYMTVLAVAGSFIVFQGGQLLGLG